MIVLPNIKLIIEQLRSESENIDRFEDDLYVPLELKHQFGKAWGKGYVAKTDLIRLATSASGENTKKSVVLVDSLLIKCAYAVPLYAGYSKFLEYAGKVRDSCPLTNEEWKLIGEEKSTIPFGMQNRLEACVNAMLDLSEESKSALRRFMVAPKSEREADLGSYKGLSRTDPFQPVAASALGQRVDYSGFINDVIMTLRNEPEITQNLVGIVERLTENLASPISDVLLPTFSDALRRCGFYYEIF